MSFQLMRLRWKVADHQEGRWEAYRHDGRQSWYVGAADTRRDAWAIMESDRRFWLSLPNTIELVPPQLYQQPGVWQ